jgi:hypothetical protein
MARTAFGASSKSGNSVAGIPFTFVESIGESNSGADIVGNEPEVDEPIRDAESASSGFTDPDSLTGSEGDAPFGYTPTGRKRKRAPGGNRGGASNGGKTATKTTRDIGNILFSVHMMGASFLKIPELMLEETEAKQLSDAVSRVSELYEIPLMDERTMAWVNLAIVAGGIYGPRVVAAKMNRKKHKGPTIVPHFNAGVENVG